MKISCIRNQLHSTLNQTKMFVRPKFVLTLVVLVFYEVSLNEVYGKPSVLETEENVETAPIFRNFPYNCPNRISRCNDGYCFSQCGFNNQDMEHGQGNSHSSYSNSWSLVHTGCKSDHECYGHF